MVWEMMHDVQLSHTWQVDDIGYNGDICTKIEKCPDCWISSMKRCDSTLA